MGRNDVVSLTYTAELKDLKKKLASIPGITEAEARKSVRELNKALKANTRNVSREAQRQAKALERSQREMIAGFKKSGELVQGELGSIISRVGTLGEMLSALGPAGLAAGAAVVALTGGIGAFAAAVGGAISATASWDEATRHLQETISGSGQLFRAPAEESAEALQTVSDATHALGVVWDRFVAQIAYVWAPALEGLAEGVLRVAVAVTRAHDAWRTGADGMDVLAQAWREATGQSEYLNQQVRDLIDLQHAQADAADGSADASHREADAARAAAEAARAHARAVHATMEAEKLQDQLLSDTLSESDRLARQYESTMERIYQLQQQGADEEEVAWARREAHARWERDQAALREREAQAEMERREQAAQADYEAWMAEQERERKRREMLQQRQEAIARAIEYEQQQRLAAAQSQIALASNVGEAVSAIIGEQAEKSKLLALFQVAINTAQGVTQAIAQWGPPPSPLGIAGIAAAVAIGGAQAAAISAAHPPTAHVGGLLSTSTALAPDETYRALRGEREVGVLTRQGVEAVNRGEAIERPLVIVQQYGHRTYDAVTADSVEMPSSPLRRAIREAPRGRVGHSRRRG